MAVPVFEVADESVDLVGLVLLQHLELHLETPALDLQVEVLVLLDADQLVEPSLLIETLLQLAVLALQLRLQGPHLISEFPNPLGVFVVLVLGAGQLALEFLLIFLQITNGLLVLHADASLAVDLGLQFVDGLL
jgi:hypothetical protein